RLGTPALTTRGFGESETRQTAHLIADVLDRPNDEANIAAVRAKGATLTRDFPVYREQGSGSRCDLFQGPLCVLPSARMKTPRSSRRATRTKAMSCAGAGAAKAATSASPPTSTPRSH